jgi:predicted permease
MAEQAPVSEVKMTNRRRMAWLSLIAGTALSVIVIFCAMFMPEVSDRVDKTSAVIIALLTFLGSPVMVYMGGAVAMNWKQGK